MVPQQVSFLRGRPYLRGSLIGGSTVYVIQFNLHGNLCVIPAVHCLVMTQSLSLSHTYAGPEAAANGTVPTTGGVCEGIVSRGGPQTPHLRQSGQQTRPLHALCEPALIQL